MAIKNLQNLVCVANIHGVCVTGTEGKESMRTAGNFQAYLSLPRLFLAGLFPNPTRPDANAAQAVKRAGRSASEAGVLASTWRTSSVRG